MLSRGRKSGGGLLNHLYHQPYRDEGGHVLMMAERMERAKYMSCRELTGHFGCVNAIEFSNRGGEWIISGGDDRRVLMWNVEEGISGISKPVSMNGQHNSNIFCLAFDPTNSKIFSGGNDEQVIVHDVQSKETTDVFSHSEAVYGLSADPVNASVFASACDDGRILIYDIRAPASEDPFILANYPSSPMHAVVHNPVEPRLLATANAKEGICLWDIRRPRSAVLRYGGNMYQQSCMSVRFNQQGDHLVALRRKLPPVLYDIQSSTAIYQFDHPGYYNSCTMKSCCFAGHRDQYVVSGSDDFNLYMWKIPEKPRDVPWVGQAHILLKGHRSIVNQVRFNPLNHLIVSSGVEKVVKMWSPFHLPKQEKGVLLSAEESQEEVDRLVYTHEEYINLVIDSGQVMTHDYSHQSTEEDPRMMAFFDSLVQRELEGCTSDDSNLSTPNEEYERVIIEHSDSTDSDSNNATPRSNDDSYGEGSNLSPFTIAFASAMASRARTGVELDAPDDSQASLEIDLADERNSLPGQRNMSNRRSISDLITMKRKEYLLGIKKKELEAKQKKKRRQTKVRQILKRQNISEDSTSSSSDTDNELPCSNIVFQAKKRHFDDTSNDTASSDGNTAGNIILEHQLKTMTDTVSLKRLKTLRSCVVNNDEENEIDSKEDHKSIINEPEASTSKVDCVNKDRVSQFETDKDTGPYLNEVTRSSSHSHSGHSQLYNRLISVSKSDIVSCLRTAELGACSVNATPDSGFDVDLTTEKLPFADPLCNSQSSIVNDESITSFRNFKQRQSRRYRTAIRHESSDDGT